MGGILNQHLRLEEIPMMREWVLKHGVRKEYKKDEYFTKEGEISRYIGYAESGSFRYVKWNYKGQEQIVGYSFERDFVVEYSSFVFQTFSPCSSQAIDDAVVWVIDYDSFNTFMEMTNQGDLRHKISEILLFDMYNRMLYLYTDSPKDRYLRLITRCPEILNLVSLKEIASFINVTPETLSRIRKKILSEE